jgi:hypothetical protein
MLAIILISEHFSVNLIILNLIIESLLRIKAWVAQRVRLGSSVALTVQPLPPLLN